MRCRRFFFERQIYDLDEVSMVKKGVDGYKKASASKCILVEQLATSVREVSRNYAKNFRTVLLLHHRISKRVFWNQKTRNQGVLIAYSRILFESFYEVARPKRFLCVFSIFGPR